VPHRALARHALGDAESRFSEQQLRAYQKSYAKPRRHPKSGAAAAPILLKLVKNQ
jgi:hypothetical protein